MIEKNNWFEILKTVDILYVKFLLIKTIRSSITTIFNNKYITSKKLLVL